MPRICYIPKTFSSSSQHIIRNAIAILDELHAQGFTATLRQLHYQFVKRGKFENTFRNYKRLGKVVGEARLAGLIDWDYMEDRIRGLEDRLKFEDPQTALEKLADWYHTDLWGNQPYRPEVWIEKDALVGMIVRVCEENDVPYFCCRGYTSLSEMWRASMRLREYDRRGQTPYIIHFGDHDPSGIDMTRDIEERLGSTFMAEFEFKRVALNMDQIRELNPPPNPAKVTDSRYKSYISIYGEESWELDALEPMMFAELIEAELKDIRDKKVWDKAVEKKEQERRKLQHVAETWDQPVKPVRKHR